MDPVRLSIPKVYRVGIDKVPISCYIVGVLFTLSQSNMFTIKNRQGFISEAGTEAAALVEAVRLAKEYGNAEFPKSPFASVQIAIEAAPDYEDSLNGKGCAWRVWVYHSSKPMTFGAKFFVFKE